MDEIREKFSNVKLSQEKYEKYAKYKIWMHFQNCLDKKLGDKNTKPIAEVIVIQFGLFNYDWHYNLMEIKETLEAVKLLNYSYYLSNKIDYTDLIVAKLEGTKSGVIGSKASSVTDAASKGLTFI